ncbi:hypothetical protein [Tolumonas lignilytica]|jgi:hypothetical protein|uniref:hypothetical protein n=1 Tax=Tolumonas lignilytica TaxID=1283284 RepID=UPI00046346AA|nr:hypothetical protein [Tolumonas lignilytica]
MSELDPLLLFANIVIGAIGTGYFIYGKRQSHMLALLAGIGLIGLTFLVNDLLWLCLWAIALMTAPKWLGQFF